MSENGERERVIEVIGAAIGLGGRSLGTRGGPQAIRAAGLLPRLRQTRQVVDCGDYTAASVVREVGRDPGAALIAEASRYLLELRAVVEAALERGSLPCVLGGDHSLGAATQAAVARHARRQGREVPGLIWIDAHTDSNTFESTPSGNLHGMMLAALHGLDVPALGAVVLGGGRDPARTVYVGARDIDEEEREIVARLGCRVMGPEEIRTRGVRAVMAEAFAIAGGGGCGGFSVSFDLDCLDPSIAPGVDCRVEGGLSWEEAREIAALIGERRGEIAAVEVVEVNPEADDDQRTARLAVEAAALLCGCGG